MKHTTHTVLRNLTDGVLLVTLVLFLFLGNVRSALIVAITIPFSLLFAAILLDLRHIPGEPAVARSARFRHGGGRVGGDGGEHPAPHFVRQHEEVVHGDHRRRRARSPEARFFSRASSSLFRTCPSLLCSGWKAGCSVPWRGPSRSPCWERWCSLCSSLRCCAASCSVAESRNGGTRFWSG